mmetsp:Transcript_32767/g.82197  ORF Transcript_32767/g.82197 Transcript_32767/m.82197 type:complete len:210 (+) Transcript_32767:143-772(+)
MGGPRPATAGEARESLQQPGSSAADCHRAQGLQHQRHHPLHAQPAPPPRTTCAQARGRPRGRRAPPRQKRDGARSDQRGADAAGGDAARGDGAVPRAERGVLQHGRLAALAAGVHPPLHRRQHRRMEHSAAEDLPALPELGALQRDAALPVAARAEEGGHAGGGGRGALLPGLHRLGLLPRQPRPERDSPRRGARASRAASIRCEPPGA